MNKEKREIFGPMANIILEGTIFAIGYYLYKNFGLDPHVYWIYIMLILIIILHITLVAMLVSYRNKQTTSDAK